MRHRTSLLTGLMPCLIAAICAAFICCCIGIPMGMPLTPPMLPCSCCAMSACLAWACWWRYRCCCSCACIGALTTWRYWQRLALAFSHEMCLFDNGAQWTWLAGKGGRTVQLLLREHLWLARVQVLKSMCVRPTWLHAAHEASGDLGAGCPRHGHMRAHLGRHASTRHALLTCVVWHPRRHWMASGYAWMLLHNIRMAKARSHTRHHLPKLIRRRSTSARISTLPSPSFTTTMRFQPRYAERGTGGDAAA